MQNKTVNAVIHKISEQFFLINTDRFKIYLVIKGISPPVEFSVDTNEGITFGIRKVIKQKLSDKTVKGYDNAAISLFLAPCFSYNININPPELFPAFHIPPQPVSYQS